MSLNERSFALRVRRWWGRRLFLEARWLAPATFVAFAVVAVALALQLRADDDEMVSEIVQESADMYANAVQAGLNERTGAMVRIADRWNAGLYPSEWVWALELAEVGAFDDEFGFALRAPGRGADWVVGDRERMRGALDKAETHVAGRGLFFVYSSDAKPESRAVFVMGLDLDMLLARTARILDQNVRASVTVQDKHGARVASGIPKASSFPRFAEVAVDGVRFTIRLDPTAEFLAAKRNDLPAQTLAAGLLLAAFAALLVRARGSAAQASRASEAAKDELAQEVARRAQAEAEMRDLYERAPCGYHSVDRDMKIIRMNQTELDWLGYQKDEVVGVKHFEDLVTPESLTIARQAAAHFAQFGYVQELELTMKRKDGTTFPVSLSATGVFDESGALLRSRTTVFDLRRRAEAEAALREKDFRLDLALTGANIGLFTWGPDRALELSAIARAQLGFGQGDAAADVSDWWARVLPEDLDRFRAGIRDFFANPWPNFEIEFCAAPREGHSRTLVMRGRLIGQGASSRLHGVLIDVSNLRAVEERFRGLLEAAPEAMVITDDEGRITLMNAQMERLFGYERHELLGRRIEVLVPERLRKGHEHHCQTFRAHPLARGMGTGRELTAVRKDGSEFPVEIALSPAGSEAVPMVIAAIRDMTAKREAEARLKEARLAAETANAAKSAFLAHMSHEIRTPLGIILGHAEMLGTPGRSPEESASSLSYIKKNAENLLLLINDVLDLAKVESGASSIEPRPFELTPFLREVFAPIALKAQEKGLKFRWQCDEDLPDVIYSDPDRLRQVLFNVIHNAIKFTEKGEVDVRVRQRPPVRGGNPRLEFLVTDTGCGIRPESHDKIFQPFTQAEPYIRRNYGGTGLGLSLSRGLAEQLGGTLELLASEPGRGSTFSVTIDEGKGDRKPMASFGVRSVGPRTLKGSHVLLVEDFEDNQVLIGALLRGKGAEVDVAVDGKDGCKQAMAGDYDVVLMDIQMPEMNGYEAVAALRAAGYARPVVALTAHAMKGERERCLAAGFDSYLTKPIKTEELFSAVALLSRRPAPVTSPEAERH